MATKNAAAIQSSATSIPLPPIANPAGMQISSTSGLIATSAAPVIAARAGVMVANERIQAGDSVWRCRVSHR